MTRIVLSYVIGLVVLGSGLLFSVEAHGQTIFLPTFRNFTYRGSVKVPDGGTIQMGGVNTHRESANSAGVPLVGNLPGIGRPFNNRSIQRESEAGQLNATARILIMEELEAEHLAGSGIDFEQRQRNAAIQQRAAFLSKHVGRSNNSTVDRNSQNRGSRAKSRFRR